MKNLLVILFLLASTLTFAQPANDNCGGAQSTIPDGTCYNGTLVNAVDNWSGEVGCATGGGANNHIDVWYSFVATGTQFDITVTDLTIGANLEVVLVTAATLPCTGPFTVHYSVCGASPLLGSYGGLTIGTTYYYTISSEGGNGNGQTNPGTFTTCVDNTTPAASGNQDCVNSTAICNNNSFNGNSNGLGAQELTAGNSGCLGVEHQSSWYNFTIQTSGTLQMLISPTNGTDDYDFAIWGPNPNCPPTVSPIRCSYAAGGGNTGMNGTAVDLTEGVFGNKWVAQMNVLAGETYVLLIDNFTASGSPFNLNWGGTASLDCAVLPIDLESFEGYNEDGVNKLFWVTATETNNDYFIIERSRGGKFWEEIGKIQGGGNTSGQNVYKLDDDTYIDGVNYYRLTQVDFNGAFETFEIIAINSGPEVVWQEFKIINLLGQEVPLDYSGIRVVLFEDGRRILVPAGMRNPKIAR